jgi:putative transposase
VILAHRIQLQPRNKHVTAFAKACGVARYTWNWALNRWATEHEAGNKPKATELKKAWNKEKPEWVYESPKDANQQPFSNLQSAFNRFFKKQGRYPKYKKKGRHDSFYISNDKLTADGRYVRLPKIGRVKMAEELRFSGKVMAATVSREADRWFISFQVETEVVPQHGSEIVGIDLGVKDAVVLSDGSKFAGPKPLKRRLRTLKKRQRKHSRKVKGSNNRRRSALRLARLHRKIKNQRKDFLHKVSSHIVSKAKTVVIEDLNVRGMLKNHKLARAISDIGFYEFRRQLEYKCKMNDVELIIADRWFPSTKLCRFCGSLNKMPLSERVYKCDCGHTEDRDVNAAQNLRTVGLAGIYACGQEGPDFDSGHSETGLDEAGTQSLVTSTSCHI